MVMASTSPRGSSRWPNPARSAFQTMPIGRLMENCLSSLVLAKRIGILHQLLPKVGLFAALVNPNSSLYEVDREEAKTTARSLGIQMHVLEASSDAALEKAFATVTERRIGALVVGADPFFNSRRRNIIEFAAQQKIPAIYPFREFSFDGGLMSYGCTLAFAYRASGLYAARILKGEKPVDLPVLQPTSFELVINLKAAKTLGIEISPNILALADEVID
jgi:putative tryptophan/tyrosine transport system substrate-binding protein